MEEIQYINSIPVSFPERKILARLRFNFHRTKLEGDDRRRLMVLMKRGFSACETRGTWRRAEIVNRGDDFIEIDDGYRLLGQSMVNFLAHSHSVIVMAVTAGSKIVEISREALGEESGARALIYDAIGSETADAAMAWLNRYLKGEVRRRGEKLTGMRFSPGYGDFSLNNQSWIYESLDMAKLGVTLSERYIFDPEKTVTAIAGVE